MRIDDILSKFSQRVNAVIVVDIGSNLKLLNVELTPKVKIRALKVMALSPQKRDADILRGISDFLGENNILQRNAILAPALKSLLIKRIQLPSIPESELPEAIKWKIKDEVPFDLSSAVLDFSIIREAIQEDGAKVLDVLCVLAQEQEIKEQVLLLKQAGLTPLAVIPLAFGYTKLAQNFLKASKEEIIGILHTDEDNSYITVHKDNKLEFYREIPFSVNKLRESLKGMLISDKGRIELSGEEADDVLFNLGVPQQNEVYKDKISSVQILGLLRPILERLSQEIKRSLNYYSDQFQAGAVDRLFMAGLTERIPNIDKFLQQELALDIHKINLGDKDIALPNIGAADLNQSYASFCLAFDYGYNINILPYEFRTEKFEKLQKVSLRWIVLMALMLLAFSYMFARVGVASYQKRLDNALLHLKVLSEVKQAKEKFEALSRFINDTRNQEPQVALALKKLSGLATKDIFFDTLSLDCLAKTAQISGFVKDTIGKADVILNKFARDMDGSLYFTEANISSMQEIKTQETKALKFSITSKLR